MNTRTLCPALPPVSVVGHGLWPIGGKHLGPADDSTSAQTIHAALEAGINLFDTAPIYGFGHSEEVLGRTLSTVSEQVILASKCGLIWDDRGRVRHDASPTRITSELETSLKRLRREAIDLYQLHWPDPDLAIEESVAAMDALRRAGKVRAIGLCNVNLEQLERARAVAPIDAIQLPYNRLDRSIEQDLAPACRRHGLGLLVYEPLARGLLTGRYGRDHRFPKRDLRSRDPRFQGERFEEGLAEVERLRVVAAREGVTIAQLAVAFAVNLKGVSSALCGARHPEHIRETAKAGSATLNLEP